MSKFHEEIKELGVDGFLEKYDEYFKHRWSITYVMYFGDHMVRVWNNGITKKWTGAVETHHITGAHTATSTIIYFIPDSETPEEAQAKAHRWLTENII